MKQGEGKPKKWEQWLLQMLCFQKYVVNTGLEVWFDDSSI